MRGTAITQNVYGQLNCLSSKSEDKMGSFNNSQILMEEELNRASQEKETESPEMYWGPRKDGKQERGRPVGSSVGSAGSRCCAWGECSGVPAHQGDSWLNLDLEMSSMPCRVRATITSNRTRKKHMVPPTARLFVSTRHSHVKSDPSSTASGGGASSTGSGPYKKTPESPLRPSLLRRHSQKTATCEPGRGPR